MATNILQKGKASVVRRPRLSNQIYDLIRSDLRSGKYTADTRFTEPAIAEELQTSRTPVREALFQLVNNGLLCEFDRGYGLPTLSKTDVSQMMDIRIALEALLLKKLCANATEDMIKVLKSAVAMEKKAINKAEAGPFIDANNQLRELLYDFADDPYLKETGELYSDRLQIFRVLTLKPQENRKLVAEAHELLIEAIEKRNTKLALSTHKTMLVNAKKAYMDAAL